MSNLNFSPIDYREIEFEDISFNNDYFSDNTENKLLKAQIEELQHQLSQEMENGERIKSEHELIQAKIDEMNSQLQ